jgi:hypothetical protein
MKIDGRTLDMPPWNRFVIGERPGLSVPNSLGVYLTYAPRIGRRDSERNCISNIHADGLSYTAAAEKLEWLMTRARMLQVTGVALKEDAPRKFGSEPQRPVDTLPFCATYLHPQDPIPRWNHSRHFRTAGFPGTIGLLSS